MHRDGKKRRGKWVAKEKKIAWKIEEATLDGDSRVVIVISRCIIIRGFD